MRAKRSKKYRKIMQTYEITFGFRPPFQILLDAAFIRACTAFHMPLQKSLENTLHGPCRLFVTKCTLAKIMQDWEIEKKKTGAVKQQRPSWLPPPTELPLRHCKHNEEGTSVEEWRCVVDLVAGQPRGNEQAKNKQHFVLATAEGLENARVAKGFVDVRERARMVPGVPVVYVKRSVMVLEELSGASEGVRRGAEREKFREGLVGGGARKRKRGEDGEDAENKDEEEGAGNVAGSGSSMAKRKRGQKAKGPNPLSVPKKKVKQSNEGTDEKDGEASSTQLGTTATSKARRRRKHGGKKDDDDAAADENESTDGLLGAHSRLQEVLA